MKIQFDSQTMNVTPTNDAKQWYMTVDEVVQGYGVTRQTVMTHLEDHADEIRDGVERGVGITDTLGGKQKKTVLYREGVIKLGFFIRSKKAASFRQWATNVVVEHLDNNNIELRTLMQQGFDRLESMMGRQQNEIDDLKAQLSLFLSRDEEKKIYALIQEVKKAKSMDGRAVVGHIKKRLGLNTPYAAPSAKIVINALNNMLGRGLTTVK